jgi:hypothetical protein
MGRDCVATRLPGNPAAGDWVLLVTAVAPPAGVRVGLDFRGVRLPAGGPVRLPPGAEFLAGEQTPVGLVVTPHVAAGDGSYYTGDRASGIGWAARALAALDALAALHAHRWADAEAGDDPPGPPGGGQNALA